MSHAALSCGAPPPARPHPRPASPAGNTTRTARRRCAVAATPPHSDGTPTSSSAAARARRRGARFSASSRRSCAGVGSRARIPHHLARTIRRQPHQTARRANLRLAVPGRTLRVESPPVPVPPAGTRRRRELLLHHLLQAHRHLDVDAAIVPTAALRRMLRRPEQLLVAAAPRPPQPTSPREIRCRRPPRSRTDRDRGRERASDVQASCQAATAVPARSHLPFGDAGMSPDGDATDRNHEFRPSRRRRRRTHAATPPLRQRRSERIVKRVDQRRVPVAVGQLDQLPRDASHDDTQPHRFIHPDSRRVERRPARRGRTLDVHPGEHVGPAVQTGRRKRHPNVDREPRPAAQALPATVSRRSGNTAGKCAPSNRLLTSPPPGARSLRPRRSQPAEDIASVLCHSTGSVPRPGRARVDPRPTREPPHRTRPRAQSRQPLRQQSYGLRCGTLRARPCPRPVSLPLPRVPAARRRHRLPRATGRGRHTAVRRHRRRRGKTARRRPRLGARRHRRRVRLPRQRSVARRSTGPDAFDARHAARPRRLRRLRPEAERRRRRRLPAPTHRRVRDRPRLGRLQRRARSRKALQRHPPLRGEETHAYLRAVLGRGRPTADVQEPEEQEPSEDQAHGGSEADLAEGAPVELRLQDDHLPARRGRTAAGDGRGGGAGSRGRHRTIRAPPGRGPSHGGCRAGPRP